MQVILSTAFICFALAVTLEALLRGQGGIWNGVSPAASIVIFFALLCFIGLLEGTQIAAFEIMKMPEKEVAQHGVAAINCKLLFSGRHFQAFLVGRQILVACLMFVVANIVTISIDEGAENIFSVGNGFQKFVDSGLLGAVVLTVVGSLAWRIVASSFPLAFMSNPIVYLIIRLCLLLEGTGICSSAFLLALIHRTIVNYQPDEVYIGILNDDLPNPIKRHERGESFGMSIRRLTVEDHDEDDIEMNSDKARGRMLPVRSLTPQLRGRMTPENATLGQSIRRLHTRELCQHDADDVEYDENIYRPTPQRGLSYLREDVLTTEALNNRGMSVPINVLGKGIRRLEN